MDQTNPSHPNTRSVAPGEEDDLTVIREQGRETIALLRALIDMLLPKGDHDGPKLEELIAALVAQQARTLVLVKQLGTDMSSLLDHLLPNGVERANG
jgi:hypothetical protein